MSSEGGEGQSIQPAENITVNNVQIHISLARHAIRDQKTYIAVRGGIEKIGENFFQRGYNNLFFIEDAIGTFSGNIDKLKSIGKNDRSYRSAFLKTLYDTSDKDTPGFVRLLDGDTIAGFKKMGIADAVTPFTYSQFAALDNLIRKGYQINLRAEVATPETQGEVIPPSTTDPYQRAKWWRDEAQRAQLVDINLASQLVELVKKEGQSRARILAIFGGAHSDVAANFPEEIRNITRTTDLTPDARTHPAAQLLKDIQRGNLSSEEIINRVNAINHPQRR